MARVCLNIGCGQTPTEGWHNYDNSLSLVIGQYPMLVNLMDNLNLLNKEQKSYLKFVKRHRIQRVDATNHIPHDDNSVDVIYTSHMLEHLDREEADAFLNEVQRVLKLGGILRIAVPNLAQIVDNYLLHRDANQFMKESHLAVPKPKSILRKLQQVFVGQRHHHWMYDSTSLIKLLEQHGFKNVTAIEAGDTIIEEPGALNLYERADHSIYVEAQKA